VVVLEPTCKRNPVWIDQRGSAFSSYRCDKKEREKKKKAMSWYTMGIEATENDPVKAHDKKGWEGGGGIARGENG